MPQMQHPQEAKSPENFQAILKVINFMILINLSLLNTIFLFSSFPSLLPFVPPISLRINRENESKKC